MKIQRISVICICLLILGVNIQLLGIALNTIVKTTNDGFMPVVDQAFDKPFIIDERHRFQKEGSFLLLADRIDFVSPEWHRYVPEMIQKNLNLPPGNEMITASIGDFIQWFGMCLYRICIPIVLILIVIYFFTKKAREKNVR